MCFVPKRCNDMMNVGRLQGFEVRLWNLDSLQNISHANFSARENHTISSVCCVCLSPWYQGKITAQGKLLQQDTFTVTEQDSSFLSRAKERRVFLFEQMVIFSEPIDRKKGFSIPGYIFKNSIKVCDSVEEAHFTPRLRVTQQIPTNSCPNQHTLHNPTAGIF